MPASKLDDFLKYAASQREVVVRAHTRVVGGKSVAVRRHGRTEDAEERKAAVKSKQQRELELWRKWKDGGQKPEDLRPLIASFQSLLRSQSKTYTGRVAMIPDSAIEAEFKIQLVNALRTYDPSKGAALGTHVYNTLSRAHRYIATYQNVGRIPENRVYKIRNYEVAHTDLLEELDRDPTTAELAERLKREHPEQGWNEAEVDRLTRELRKDLVTQGFEVDPHVVSPSRESEILKLFVYELDGDERKLYRHLTGIGAKKVTSTAELSEMFGVESYKISRMKARIQAKMKPFLAKGD